MRHIKSDLDHFLPRIKVRIARVKILFIQQKNFRVSQLAYDHHIFRLTISAGGSNGNGTEHCKLREEYFLLAVKSIPLVR